jgi:hypothetical protein
LRSPACGGTRKATGSGLTKRRNRTKGRQAPGCMHIYTERKAIRPTLGIGTGGLASVRRGTRWNRNGLILLVRYCLIASSDIPGAVKDLRNATWASIVFSSATRILRGHYCQEGGACYECPLRSFKNSAARGSAATAFIRGRAKSSNSRAPNM